MGRVRPLAALCAALLGVTAAPGVAAAETAGAPSTSTSTTPVAPTTPTSTPVAGQLALTLEKVGGSPTFALAGRRIVVRGKVTPYVAGQTVAVSFYLDGRRVALDAASVLPAAHGKGQFSVDFSSRYAGLLQVRAAHAATAQQGAFATRALRAFGSSTRTSVSARGASRCACCNRSWARCTTRCR